MPPQMQPGQGSPNGPYSGASPMPANGYQQPGQNPGGYSYGQLQLPSASPAYSPSPYAPPAGQSAPLYANQPAGSMADVPRNPYTWQQGIAPASRPTTPTSSSAQPVQFMAAQPLPSQQPYSQVGTGQNMMPQGAASRQYQYQSQQAQPVQGQPQTFSGQTYPQYSGSSATTANSGYASPQMAYQQARYGSPYGQNQQQYPQAAGMQGYAQPGTAAAMMQQQMQQYQEAPHKKENWIQRLFRSPRKVVAVGGVSGAALLLIVGLTAMTGGGQQSSSSFSLFGSSSKAPEELFQAALENALQTKNYTQKISSSNRSLERSVDVSAVKSPRLNGKATVKDTSTSFEAYADRDNTIVKLTSSPSLDVRPNLADTWVQVRKDAVLLDTSGTGGTSLDVLFTPTTALYSGFIFGNYSQADRETLLAIMKDQVVYRFDPSSVTQASVDGQSVSQYTVTVSASGQQALSAKAQILAGVDQVRIGQAATIARLSGSANARIIVSVSNSEQRIVRVAPDGGNGDTVQYSNVDITKVMEQVPRAQDSWDSYAAKLAGR